MKTFKCALAAGVLASMATAAFAQTGAPEQPAAPKAAPDQTQPKLRGRMAALDANNDGSVDEAEFATIQNFKEADANADGVLSSDELAAMIEKRRVERLAQRLTRRLDIDGDGTVTIAEIEKNRQERFALMDRNDDGKLEGDELRRGGRDRDHHKNGRHWKKRHSGDRGGHGGDL